MLFATTQMIDDVSDLAKAGRAVPTAPRQFTVDESTRVMMRDVARFAGRNKRKIVLAGVSLVVAGILTGGVAVGVAAVGKAAAYLGGRIYRRWERWRREKEVRGLFTDLFDESTGRFRNIDFAVGEGGVSDERFGQIIQAVQVLIAHRDFSTMVSAFTDLMEAGQTFTARYERARAGVTNCAQAIELLQSLYNFSYHFERLRYAISFFDNLVLFVVLETTRMEAEFEQKMPSVVQYYNTTMIGDPLQAFNDAANSSAVLHTRFYESKKDYIPWVKAAIEPFWRQFTWNQRGTHVATRRMVGMEGTIGDAVIEGVKGAVPISAVSSTLSTGSTTGTEAIIRASGGQVVQASTLTSASTGGGEAVAGILTEIANAKWNSTLYQSGKVWRGWNNWRDQTLVERVEVIKSVLKPSLERFVTKFDHWRTSHKEFMANAYSTTCLRTRKHWAQSVGSESYKMICEFHQTVVGMANVEAERIFGNDPALARRYREFIESEGRFARTPATSTTSTPSATCVADDVQVKVDELLTRHGTMLEPCSGYCYMPNKFLHRWWSVMPAVTGDKGEIPIKPIGSTARNLEVTAGGA